jgi:glyoxylase-like metal-dependent hydrolase (beta-lactamase superfamily II)
LTFAELRKTAYFITMAQDSSSLPAATVSVHALSCGHFTLPEHQFVKPSSLDARRTVPSLAFLIQHRNSDTNKQNNILFDLGLRGDLTAYPASVQKHIETRRPIESRPDIVDNLAKGGLRPEDIDYVILSHVFFSFSGTMLKLLRGG